MTQTLEQGKDGSPHQTKNRDQLRGLLRAERLWSGQGTYVILATSCEPGAGCRNRTVIVMGGSSLFRCDCVCVCFRSHGLIISYKTIDFVSYRLSIVDFNHGV